MRLTNISFVPILVSLLIIITTEAPLLSNEPSDSLQKSQKFFIGISGGASVNKIISEGILSVSDMTTGKVNTYSGSFRLEIGYFFSGSIGISTGLGYNSFKNNLSLAAYSNKFTTTDSENETYERRITGSDIKEFQSISFLEVPFCLNLNIPAGSSFGFFLQAGLNMSVPLVHEYNGSGTFSYSGYYPAYNVLLQDLPAYGFPANAAFSTTGNLEIRPFELEGLASAGFQYTIKRKFQIAIGVNYSRSLSNISNYKESNQFQLSSDADRINSLMGGCKEVFKESLGLKLSFRYYFR